MHRRPGEGHAGRRSSYLSSALTQHRIDEGHDGRFQVDLVPVTTRAAVQVVDQRLQGNREELQRHNVDFLHSFVQKTSKLEQLALC